MYSVTFFPSVHVQQMNSFFGISNRLKCALIPSEKLISLRTELVNNRFYLGGVQFKTRFFLVSES